VPGNARVAVANDLRAHFRPQTVGAHQRGALYVSPRGQHCGDAVRILLVTDHLAADPQRDPIRRSWLMYTAMRRAGSPTPSASIDRRLHRQV
jgi:hypothetical protein